MSNVSFVVSENNVPSFRYLSLYCLYAYRALVEKYVATGVDGRFSYNTGLTVITLDNVS